MTELQTVIDTLDNAADSFDGIATKEQKKIYDEVLLLAKDLDTDASGKVKQSIANLKRLTQIKAHLSALSKNKEWVSGISQFAKYFGILQQQQNAYFSDHFPELTLSETSKKKHELQKQIAVQNTMDALIGRGLKANVTDKINDILLRAVTSGAKFADLQEELRAHLLGKDGGQGAFARYATTYATTALSQFTGQNNKLLTDDLDTEWFMYVGSNKETTRPFCEACTRKKYIHRSEIHTLLTGHIHIVGGDDVDVPIYAKTNLPYGMIDGTNEDNFQINVGGWNCRHQLVPVADAVVPKNIRDKIDGKMAKDISETYEQIHDNRTQDKIDTIRKSWMVRQMRGMNLTDKEKQVIAQNNLQIEEVLKIGKGAPMTYDEADKQSTNPNYGKTKGYGINCQTCAPAYMLRLRGFDITAKENTWLSAEMKELSLHWTKCWKNEDGARSLPITFKSWMSKNGYGRMTAKRYRSFFDEVCSEVGVYEIGLTWKSKGGHCTIIERKPNGELVYIEPQHDNSKGSGRESMDIDYLCRMMTAEPPSFTTKEYLDCSDGVLRIDNKQFDINYLSIFEK